MQAAAITSTVRLRAMAQRTRRAYSRWIQRFRAVPPSWPWPAMLPAFRKREQSMGVSTMAMMRLKMTATATVMPKEKKNRPMRPCMKARGRKITTSDEVVATTASMISFVPSRAAWKALLPSSSMCRYTFSSTTMASSMTMPTASTRPSSV